MADTRSVKGLAQLQAFLNQLPAKMEANVMRGALRAGARPIAEEAKANVAVEDGDLRASIKVSTKRQRGVVMAVVKAGSKKAFYASWVETGTAAHQILPRNAKALRVAGVAVPVVNHPGARPKPYMRPALDARATDAVVAAAEYIKKRLATKHGLDTADVDIKAEE